MSLNRNILKKITKTEVFGNQFRKLASMNARKTCKYTYLKVYHTLKYSSAGVFYDIYKNSA